jgi:hypothetical protein
MAGVVQNAAMPWTSPDTEAVDHPAYAFDCRVGELIGPDDEQTGHVVVNVWTQRSRIGGLLWWRRWGRPTVVADLTLVPADREPGLWVSDEELEWDLSGEDLTLAVASWATGELALDDTVYTVDWLSVEAGDTKAVEQWGWDLPGQRLRT